MRRYSLLLALLSGCLHSSTHTAIDGAVLGRVVIYRNGVAFYERRATVEEVVAVLLGHGGDARAAGRAGL